MARREIKFVPFSRYVYNEQRDTESAFAQTVSYISPKLNQGHNGHQIVNIEGTPNVLSDLIKSGMLPCLVEFDVTDRADWKGNASAYILSAKPVQRSVGLFQSFIKRVSDLPSNSDFSFPPELAHLAIQRYLILSSYYFNNSKNKREFSGLFGCTLDESLNIDGSSGNQFLKFTADVSLLKQLDSVQLPSILDMAVESGKRGNSNYTHVMWSKYDSSVSGLWQEFLNEIFGVSKSAAPMPADKPARRKEGLPPLPAAGAPA